MIPILVANLWGSSEWWRSKSCCCFTDPNLMMPSFQGDIYIYMNSEAVYFDVYIYVKCVQAYELYIHNMIVHRFSSLAFFRIFGQFLNSRDLLKILPFLSPRLESFRDLVLGLNTKTIPVVLQRPFTNPESARCWLDDSIVLPNGNFTELKSWCNQAMQFPRYIVVQHIIHYYTVLRIQKF